MHLVCRACQSGVRRSLLKDSGFRVHGRRFLRFSSVRSQADAPLRRETVTVKSVNGNELKFDAVVQDTMPMGSDVGTVVGIHGSPGSHKDFKYMVPILQEHGIRFVGINFPGYGYTKGLGKFSCYFNSERLQFVQGIVDRLGLSKRLVFVGHSRGSENALKLGATNTDRTTAVVLVNPIGLKVHRGIRPTSVLAAAAWLWNTGSLAQFFMRPILFVYFKKVIKFKVSNSDEAALTVLVMNASNLEDQREFIQKINGSRVQVLTAFAGVDPLIEPEVSQHFADSFRGTKNLVCSAENEEQSTVWSAFERLVGKGERRIAVYFEKEGHFLQKHRAKFLAQAIVAFFKADS